MSSYPHGRFWSLLVAHTNAVEKHIPGNIEVNAWQDPPHLTVESSLHFREGRRFPLYSMFPKIHSPGSLMVPIYSTFQLLVPFKPSNIPTFKPSGQFHSNLPVSLIPTFSSTQTFHFNLLTSQHSNLPTSQPSRQIHSNLPFQSSNTPTF